MWQISFVRTRSEYAVIRQLFLFIMFTKEICGVHSAGATLILRTVVEMVV